MADYLLKEDGGKFRLESGLGFILLEIQELAREWLRRFRRKARR